MAVPPDNLDTMLLRIKHFLTSTRMRRPAWLLLLIVSAGAWYFFPPLPRYSFQTETPIQTWDISRDGRLLAIMDLESVTVWDVATHRPLASQAVKAAPSPKKENAPAVVEGRWRLPTI